MHHYDLNAVLGELIGLHDEPCSVASGNWIRATESGGKPCLEWPKSPPARCCMELHDEYDPELTGGLCRKCAKIERLYHGLKRRLPERLFIVLERVVKNAVVVAARSGVTVRAVMASDLPLADYETFLVFGPV